MDNLITKWSTETDPNEIYIGQEIFIKPRKYNSDYTNGPFYTQIKILYMERYRDKLKLVSVYVHVLPM